jgi:hypothetical protein
MSDLTRDEQIVVILEILNPHPEQYENVLEIYQDLSDSAICDVYLTCLKLKPYLTKLEQVEN